MRNNIIIGCNDVGIYVNECANCQFYHNTLYDTTGIDCRFTASSCDVQNNVLAGGSIRTRDGSTVTNSAKNLLISAATAQAWFTDPANLDFSLASPGTVPADLLSDSSWQGSNLFTQVSQDLCLISRPSTGVVTAGALEFAAPDFVQCDTTAIRDETPPDQSSVTPSASPQPRGASPQPASESASSSPQNRRMTPSVSPQPASETASASPVPALNVGSGASKRLSRNAGAWVLLLWGGLIALQRFG